MSEAKKANGVSESTESSGSDQQEQEQKQQENKVAYETYRKTLDEAKKAKSKADEMARKLKEYEEKEMAAQGKSQELIESLRNQVKEKDEKLQAVVGNFAYKAVESQLKAEAIKQGCLDVDLLLKAGASEFSKIEVDAENGFSANQDDVKRFFETTMSKHPMLFKKSAPKFYDGNPANSVEKNVLPIKEMKHDDLINAWKNLK